MQELNELLGELYSLRAAMSLISINKDIIQQKETAFLDKEYEEKRIKRRYEDQKGVLEFRGRVGEKEAGVHLLRLEENYAREKKVITEKYREISQSIQNLGDKNKRIIGILYDSFSTIVAVSDWENVDLLIYYLETRRAESIKEALLLVDKQKQAEMIAGEIRKAGEAICDKLERGFSMIADWFQKLHDQRERQHREKMDELRRINANIEALNDSWGEFATELSGALQEKADVSSVILAQDVHYIKIKMM